MAIGLAFVDILGDTSRTADQIERDMNRVLAVVQDEIQELEVDAAVQQGTEQDLVRELNQQIRAVNASIQAVQVRTDLDPQSQRQLVADMRRTVTQARARIGEIEVRADVRGPIRQVEQVVQQVQRQVVQANATIPPVRVDVDVDEDQVSRLRTGLAGIGGAAAGAVRPVGLLGGGLAALGGSVQTVFALVSSLQQIAPAAFLAAPAITSVVLTTQTLKLAMVGVGDAVKAAMDPSDAKAFNEAIEGLAPNAREFARAVRQAQPAFTELQQGVQNRVFAGLATELRDLSKTVLPVVRDALNSTAETLNSMALQVSGAAEALATDGILGRALQGATDGLKNLTSVPQELIIIFARLAETAGPQFERVTAGIARGVDSLLGKVEEAQQSGRLAEVFEEAIDQVLILADVLGNIAEIFGNITNEASGFEGIFVVLQKITRAIADVTGTDAAQKAFAALFETVNLLTETALPVLTTALKFIGETFVAVKPGIDAVITALGPALTGILNALGPVVVAAGEAFAELLISAAPLITFAGDLVAALLPVLIPVLNGLATIFQQMAPLVQSLAGVLSSLFLPILSVLPGLIQPFVDQMVEITSLLLPIFEDLLVELQPSISDLAQGFAQVAKDLAPLIAEFVQLQAEIARELLPLLRPLIQFMVELAGVFSGVLTRALNDFVAPALRTITALMNNDVPAAKANAARAIEGLEGIFRDFAQRVPVMVTQAFQGLGEALVDAGADIINGLIRGIRSQLPSLRGVLNSVTDLIPDWKGPESRDRVLLTPAGMAIMEGLIAGIESQIPNLQGSLGGITTMVGRSQFGVGGVTVPASAAGFAGMSTPAPAAAGGIPMVQVFVGDQQITDIVDVRLARADAAQGRRLMTGVRR